MPRRQPASESLSATEKRQLPAQCARHGHTRRIDRRLFNRARGAPRKKTTQVMENTSQKPKPSLGRDEGCVECVIDISWSSQESESAARSRLRFSIDSYFRVGGSAALSADTPSTPAILQIGCEKSFCKLGSATRPW